MRSLIRIFPGRILDSQGCKVSSCRQRGPWADCADAQADLNLRWAHTSEGSFFHVETQMFRLMWNQKKAKLIRLSVKFGWLRDGAVFNKMSMYISDHYSSKTGIFANRTYEHFTKHKTNFQREILKLIFRLYTCGIRNVNTCGTRNCEEPSRLCTVLYCLAQIFFKGLWTHIEIVSPFYTSEIS